MRSILGCVVSAMLLAPATARAQYVPSGELGPGPELVVVFIASSTCVANGDSAFLASVPVMMESVGERARANGMNPVLVGVAMDGDIGAGIRYLADFGAFDEISVGRDWGNAVVIDRVWEDEDTPPSIPQVLVYTRDVRSAPRDRIEFADERLLLRLLGPDAIVAWTRDGTPIPAAPPAPLDTVLDMGDHRLHFVVYRGERPVAVVMESGGGSELSSWGEAPARIAAATGATVVAYDRAGIGGSTLPPGDLTIDAELDDLREALARLGVDDSVVAVGTSYGAMISVLFAADPRNRVAGVVLVDPMNPGFVRATGDFVPSSVRDIPNPQSDRERTIMRMKATLEDVLAAVEAAEPALTQPMVVITAGVPWWGRPDIEQAWRASHDEIAARGRERRLVVAEGSRHMVGLNAPESIVRSVELVLAAASAGGFPY